MNDLTTRRRRLWWVLRETNWPAWWAWRRARLGFWIARKEAALREWEARHPVVSWIVAFVLVAIQIFALMVLALHRGTM